MELTTGERKLIRDRCNSYRVQDKRKGRDYSNNVKLEQWLEIWAEQDGKCWYTGRTLTIENASLERIDCSKGHSADNCVLVIAAVNFSRGNKDLITFCRYLNRLGLLRADAAEVLRQMTVA